MSVSATAVDVRTLFESLHEAYPDALVVVDADGRVVLANPAASALLGYSNTELVGIDVDALVPDALRSRHAAHRHGYGRNPGTRAMGMRSELAARRRDGSEVTVEIALSPLRSEGRLLVVAAIRDVGSYPRVRQALARARYGEMLAELGRLAVDARDPKLLLDRVPHDIAEALGADDATVFLLEADRLAFRVAGTAGELPGLEADALVAFRPDTAAGFIANEGRPVHIANFATESRFRVPEADVRAGLKTGLGVPISDRGRAIGVLMVRSRRDTGFGADEIRFLESASSLLSTSLQRAESEEALSHAQRLESVGQLTGGIAHDFNNLLTVIQGNLQVLEELPAVAGDAQARHCVATALRATQRSAELTGKLLAFSRRQVLQPARVDIRHLLTSLADMLRRTLDRRIRIGLDIDGSPACLADPMQLESALLNIAINARDAMEDGGTISFKAAACAALPPAAGGRARPDAASQAGFVAISISDTGSGMTDAVRERAFEPFFTTKATGRGTGLGLSTVYGFVAQSAGAIALDSSVGHGTTVTLYIPQATALDAAEHDDPAIAAIAQGTRVLLVEDDSEVRNVVHGYLRSLGCTVQEATTAEQALPVLANESAFEVLLSDIALGPGARGTQLAAQAQGLCPALGIVLMSAFSAELIDADRTSPPSWELLGKPFSRDQLARSLAKVLRR